MKKNITINLFGQLYAIDEDAYELLKRYEENMRSYFLRREGGEEIADDIEHRVAELLSELKARGVEAVSAEHIEEIIRRIGNPEEMDESSSDFSREEATSEANNGGARGWFARRKLYRDSQDTLVGGVISGLCHYFGGTDPLPWRIGFVLLCIFSFSTAAIAYLILWAFVPQARTAEERLQMCGRPVNASAINEEIMNGTNRAANYVRESGVPQKARGCMGALLTALVVLFKGSLFVAGCLLLIAAIVGVALAIYISVAALVGFGDVSMYDGGFVYALQNYPPFVWLVGGLAVAVLIAVSIPFYALTRWLLMRSARPLGFGKRLTLIVLWIVSFAAVWTLGVIVNVYGKKAGNMLDRERNTRNGIYLSHGGWNRLDEKNLTLVSAENLWYDVSYYDFAVNRTYNPGSSVTEEEQQAEQKLRACVVYREDAQTDWKFRLQRSEYVAPGRYLVEGIVSRSVRPGHLFAQLPGEDKPHVGISSASEISGWNVNEDLIPSPVYDERVMYYELTDGWKYVTTDTLSVKGGTVHFGFSNDS
ncbi:MAG: PspC domain-containing protein, partial [Bacteroidaceae bacterium]|nr:PspC domain-containing protein [Bacteroidaceae bacterium]